MIKIIGKRASLPSDHQDVTVFVLIIVFENLVGFFCRILVGIQATMNKDCEFIR